jgi:hypothetical protein
LASIDPLRNRLLTCGYVIWSLMAVIAVCGPAADCVRTRQQPGRVPRHGGAAPGGRYVTGEPQDLRRVTFACPSQDRGHADGVRRLSSRAAADQLGRRQHLHDHQRLLRPQDRSHRRRRRPRRAWHIVLGVPEGGLWDTVMRTADSPHESTGDVAGIACIPQVTKGGDVRAGVRRFGRGLLPRKQPVHPATTHHDH